MPKVTANICKNRHGKFYFRLVIPIRFRIHFPKNKREIRRTLKTDSQSLAIKRARLMRVRYDLLLEEIEDMNKSNAIRTGLITEFDAFGNKFELDFKGDFDKEMEYADRRIEKSFEHQLQLASLQSTNNTQSSTPKISELAKAYLHAKEQRSKLSAKTLKEYQAAYDTLIFILGDIEVSKLTPQNMNTFYDELRVLPSGRNNSKLFEGKSFEELKLITIPEDKKPSTRTVNKIMDRNSSLLEFAKNQGLIPSNHAKSVMREKDEVHSKNKRDMFSDDELKNIFESPHFTDGEWRKGQGRKEPYRFWLPLIALFTGARLGEICQLNKSDIVEENGIWAFNITDEYDKKTGDKIKSIKNQNSIRKIPVSQTLIDIGIKEYVAGIKTKELFPELKLKEDGIGAAQKWVNNFLKKCGVHSKFTKTFHSLRHTFINRAITSGIDAKFVGGITGHLNKDEFGSVAELANTYFKGYSPDILKIVVIDKMEHPINFSLIQW